MVNAKFMKDATVADSAAEPGAAWEDTDAQEQMEQIEKMMRPLTQVHPAAIIAGTIVAGTTVWDQYLVFS